jgi:hypothetical protein
MPEQSERDQKKPNLVQVVASVLAAFFGVQSEQNRQRDFAGGNPLVFIVVGLVLTALFVLTVWGAVQLVLPG